MSSVDRVKKSNVEDGRDYSYNGCTGSQAEKNSNAVNGKIFEISTFVKKMEENPMKSWELTGIYSQHLVSS